MSLVATSTMAEPVDGSGRRPVSPAVAMMTRMLKSSLAFAHAMWLVAVGICFWIDGPLGMANAAVGGGSVVFFYAAGQGIQMLAGELDPHSGMGLTVASFVTRAALLGLLWVGLSSSTSAQAAFRPVSFFLSLLLVLAGWLLGMFLAWSQLRVPVYDADWDPRPLVRSAGMRKAQRARRQSNVDQRGEAE